MVIYIHGGILINLYDQIQIFIFFIQILFHIYI